MKKQNSYVYNGPRWLPGASEVEICLHVMKWGVLLKILLIKRWGKHDWTEKLKWNIVTAEALADPSEMPWFEIRISDLWISHTPVIGYRLLLGRVHNPGQGDSFRLKVILGDRLVYELSIGTTSYTWGNNFLGLKGGFWVVYYSIHYIDKDGITMVTIFRGGEWDPIV